MPFVTGPMTIFHMKGNATRKMIHVHSAIPPKAGSSGLNVGFSSASRLAITRNIGGLRIESRGAPRDGSSPLSFPAAALHTKRETSRARRRSLGENDQERHDDREQCDAFDERGENDRPAADVARGFGLT